MLNNGYLINIIYLKLFNLLELNLSDCSDSHKIFEPVGNGVWHGSNSGVPDGEGYSGDILNSSHESGTNVILGDVQNFGAEGGTVIVDGQNVQSVGERRNFEHIQ